VAGSAILTLCAGEVFLRVFRPVEYLRPPRNARPVDSGDHLHAPSAVSGLSYELLPSRDLDYEGTRIRTNRLGLRGPEFEERKEPDRFRVAVLGDSFTFGYGVPEEKTYPRLLEGLLNGSPAEGGPGFEVLNFGVVGYSTRDEAIVLARKVLPLHPDLVLIGYVFNDPEIDPRLSLHKYFDPPSWWRRSHVLRLFHFAWNRFQILRLGGGDYETYLHAENGRKWRSVLVAFDAIEGLAKTGRFEVMLVIFPKIPKVTWGGYLHAPLHDQVARVARERGFRVVDLLPVYRAQSPARLRLSPGDDHPGELGHRLAAAAIFRALAEAPGSRPEERGSIPIPFREGS
jgi:lysophospholipase L1-like esterase